MIPCAVEGFKLCVSSFILLLTRLRERESSGFSFTVPRFLSFALPAFCYFVSNNCMFYIIRDLGPAAFQILNNLKVLSTGILMRVFLNRQLSLVQWKALFILVIGSMVSQLGGGETALAPRFTPYMYVFINSFSAGAGGVLSEKLLKGTGGSSDSIHWQNAQLYFFGLAFGIISSFEHLNHTGALFRGFNEWAVATVVSLSICGLLVSFVLKYLDNFAKCFIQAVSMLLVAVIHAGTRQEMVSLQLFLAICLVCLAIDQYNLSR